MAIKDYSATAGNNTSIAGINIAEGCPAANINNAIRAEMADTRSFYEAATWTDLGHTPTRTGNTTFTINSDVTAYYTVGRRIKMFDTLTYYGTIASAVYSAPNTTVTVTMDSGTLSASLFAVAVGLIDPTNAPIPLTAISGYTNELSDASFRVVGSSDATKKVALEVDGLTTATTRTLSIQDKDGILPVIETSNILIPATAAGPSSISLAEDTDNGTNTVTIIAPASVASDKVLTLPDATGTIISTADKASTSDVQTGTSDATYITPAGLRAGSLVLSSSQSLTGTSVVFGSIPSWVKRVTVMISGLSTNSTVNPRIQLGTSGGIVSTGYSGSVGNNGGITPFSDGVQLAPSTASTNVIQGIVTFVKVTGNTWCFSGTMGYSDASGNYTVIGGVVDLGAALTQLRFYINGTASFDAGGASVMWE